MLEISLLTWGVTIGLIVALLAVDLILAAVRPHRVGFKEATAWSIFYIAVAIAFGVWFMATYGTDFGTQYFAGYIVEKSLSVDNLFVFVIIMATFAVPEEHQHKVLTFGIILALIMRAIFIAVGATLLSLFSFMFLIFGILLILTAVQLFRHRDEDPDVENNIMIKATRKFLPLSDDYDGGKLTTRIQGRKMATPLLAVLIAIGNSSEPSMLPVVRARLRDESALVRGAAVWALSRLAPAEGALAAGNALSHEDDVDVRAEWRAAIAANPIS